VPEKPGTRFHLLIRELSGESGHFAVRLVRSSLVARRLEAPHKILSRELLALASRLQFEQRGEDFGGGELRFQLLDDLVEVHGLINFEHPADLLFESEGPSNNDAVCPACDSPPGAGVSASCASQAVPHKRLPRSQPALPLKRVTGSDSRAAVFRGFDHENATGNPSDDAIANREILRRGKSARRELGDERSTDLENLIRESRVLFSMNYINTNAEYRHGFAFFDETAPR
jgi:hypothetical protein